MDDEELFRPRGVITPDVIAAAMREGHRLRAAHARHLALTAIAATRRLLRLLSRGARGLVHRVGARPGPHAAGAMSR